jgi:hypothetical protein
MFILRLQKLTHPSLSTACAPIRGYEATPGIDYPGNDLVCTDLRSVNALLLKLLTLQHQYRWHQLVAGVVIEFQTF